jgi:hypothetical protein
MDDRARELLRVDPLSSAQRPRARTHHARRFRLPSALGGGTVAAGQPLDPAPSGGPAPGPATPRIPVPPPIPAPRGSARCRSSAPVPPPPPRAASEPTPPSPPAPEPARAASEPARFRDRTLAWFREGEELEREAAPGPLVIPARRRLSLRLVIVAGLLAILVAAVL